MMPPEICALIAAPDASARHAMRATPRRLLPQRATQPRHAAALRHYAAAAVFAAQPC
jgi:hypothetical protein